METNDQKHEKKSVQNQLNDDAHFENPNIDPGFPDQQAEESNTLKGREDKRENDIDAKLSIKEMREAREREEEELRKSGG